MSCPCPSIMQGDACLCSDRLDLGVVKRTLRFMDWISSEAHSVRDVDTCSQGGQDRKKAGNVWGLRSVNALELKVD